tara:strand:+ start:458 stop:775 length:318 start_codon:yes stop_codon:yes gene_type:complete
MKTLTFKPSTATVAVGVFSEIVPADINRRAIQIQNQAELETVVLFLDPADGTVASEALSIVLKPGEFYEPFNTPSNSIQAAVVAAGTGVAEIFIATTVVNTVTTN